MFRFTIRDTLWLMVVVGLAASWAIDHWQLRDDWQKLRKDDTECSERMNEDLLSEAGRIARETGQAITIKTRFASFVGNPSDPP